jgi:hypothetical protein
VESAPTNHLEATNPSAAHWLSDTSAERLRPDGIIEKDSTVVSTPDPTGVITAEVPALIIWMLVGAGGAGLALRRRRRTSRWSAENRQAIYAMFDSRLRH